MSLNHLTNCNDPVKNILEIGCKKICVENIEGENAIINDITTNELILNNNNGTTTIFKFPDGGQSGYALKTDGNIPNATLYWGPDETSAGGITYTGTQPAITGNHIKISSTDASLCVESKINETTTDLNVNNLKITNLIDPLNPQDGATKNYVDNAISGNINVNKQMATGVYSGGHITKNISDTTKFDITAGDGVIVNPLTGDIYNVSWNSQSGISILNSNPVTFVQIDNTGTIIKTNIEPLPEDNRDKLFLGKINTPDGVSIETIDEHIYTSLNIGNSLIDLSKALGHINLSGNIISKGSGLMSIQKTEGTIYAYGSNFSNNIKNPNQLFLPAGDTASGLIMEYYMKNGNISSTLTTINPNYYDNGGNYPGSLVQTNEWTVQRVFSSSSKDNHLHIMLGQNVYVQKEDAINAISTELFEVPQSLIDDDVLLGYIVVKQGTLDLTNATFIRASKFSGVGGSGSAPAIDLSKIANFTSASQSPDITNINGVIRNDGTLPTNNNDLVSKQYVDGLLSSSNFVLKSGDTMSGLLDMGTNYVRSNTTPTDGTHLVNKLYVDGKDSLYLLISGGFLTGDLSMQINDIKNVDNLTFYNSGGVITTLRSNATTNYNLALPLNAPLNSQILEVNNTGQLSFVNKTSPYDILIACSDETTALTIGTNKVSFRIPRAFLLTGVRASLTTAQTSGLIFTVDINLSGTTILSTKLTIDNGLTTSKTSSIPAVISNSTMIDDGLITIDIDQVGDGTAKGLKVCLIGTVTF